MTDVRRPLYYTFGNHMHWVGMQWLWGYGVLPGSVRDMLRLIEETGIKGNVNFDGITYEKMAAECPEALADLRGAVARGDVEPVGCSFGQPYGLFNGGESNIRQLTHGIRAVRRLLGVRPMHFWEEEFYFFPQLPQLLRQCGITGASMFFQWTWHTPEVPKEPHSLILWEGIDGSQILTLPRNDLNVHQWPEDFDGLLEGPQINERKTEWGPPVIAQWLELIPSRDWMCRAELLLPRLKELMADERFEVRSRTCSQLIEELKQNSNQSPHRELGVPSDQTSGASVDIPVRNYTMDDVWHGMTLGKHGDRHPRTSRQIESLILFAESMSAVASLFGRPYPSWDVYPTWEIDEAWRELLVAQHHDNHECESVCGFIGYHQMEKAKSLALEVATRSMGHMVSRSGCQVFANPKGWEHNGPVMQCAQESVVIPPFGFTDRNRLERESATAVCDQKEVRVTLTRGQLTVVVDLERGGIVQMTSADCPEGVLASEGAFIDMSVTRGGTSKHLGKPLDAYVDKEGRGILLEYDDLTVEIIPSETVDGIDIRWYFHEHFVFPDAGLESALTATVNPSHDIASIHTDAPLSAQSINATPSGTRKYPKGDWMTSVQWFEPIKNAVHAHTWLDLRRHDGRGLLVINNGSQQWFRTDKGMRAVLVANDPWDGARAGLDHDQPIAMRLVPHGLITDRKCTKLAAEFGTRDDGGYLRDIASGVRPAFGVGGGDLPTEPDIPSVFGPLSLDNAPNVLAHAFLRESMKSGEHLPDWAGHRMFAESDGACDHPFVIRLVEWDGEKADVSLILAGDVAMAAKTNVMGETGDWKVGEAPADATPHLQDTGWLDIKLNVAPPAWAIVDGEPIAFKGQPIRWSRVRFPMRPREITTVMADMVMGRKEWRDLDAKRSIWATVHKTKGDTDGKTEDKPMGKGNGQSKAKTAGKQMDTQP